jgi:hypothetical protein
MSHRIWQVKYQTLVTEHNDPTSLATKGHYCSILNSFNFVHIPVNPVSFLSMPPTSLFGKYYMHPAMLCNTSSGININALHVQQWTIYRSASYTCVWVGLCYQTIMDSINLCLLEIWLLWDVIVCQVSGLCHFKG